MKYHALFVIFEKGQNSKLSFCNFFFFFFFFFLLQIIGGALRVIVCFLMIIEKLTDNKNNFLYRQTV